MTKRSHKVFARKKHDLYQTWDKRAIVPLLPYIAGLRYWEPCAGQGDLIDLLTEHSTAELCAGTDIDGEYLYRDARLLPRMIHHV
jgi:hypothetical protein